MIDVPDDAIDIGHDHHYKLTVWEPDRGLNPQYDGVPDIDPCGAIIWHRRPDNGELCGSAITFDVVGVEIFGDRPRWQLHSLDPLHVEPSLLCRACGDHGWIRGGRWEQA